MTKTNWRTLIITSAIILATMVYGMSQYASLPATVATHWGVNNQPNGWMPKALAVYGIPLIMLVLHWITVGSAMRASRRGNRAPRLERITAWIFPVVTVVLYVVTIRYAQGQPVNIRLWALVVVAAVFIALGNYLPTTPATLVHKGWSGFGYHVPWAVTNPAGALKTMRRLGQVMVGGGLVMLGSLFFPPVVSVVALIVVIAALLVVLGLSYSWTTRPAKH